MEPHYMTKGRRHDENYSVRILNPFLEDFVRIRHSKAYRRLADKTQVISLPRNVYTRTRLTHTGEVVAIATTISEALKLNTPLCMAIGEGHDIGHAPYGHLGEEMLTQILGRTFRHPVGGPIVAQHIEKGKPSGLNLSFETLQGILYHSRTNSVQLKGISGTPNEYSVVMFADKIAYTFSDLNDAMRYGFLKNDELPDFVNFLGKTQNERTYSVLNALINESKDCGRVEFQRGEVYQSFIKTREFMFKKVYKAIDHSIKKVILQKAHEFLSTEPAFSSVNPEAALLMLTDKQVDALGRCVNERGRCRIGDLSGLGISDSLETLKGKDIDLCDADLGWGDEREREVI